MSKIAGASVPPLGPYSLKAKVVGSVDEVIELRDLAARMGESALSGKAAVQIKDRPVISATLSSDLIDIADFTKGGGSGTDAKPGAQAPSGAKPGAPPAGGGGERLFPDDPLPVDGLRAADANVDLTVEKLLAGKIAVQNVHTAIALRNGNLAVTPIEADVAKGKLSGMIQLKASQATPALDLKLSGKKIDVGQLLTDMEITDLLYGVINTDIDAAGQGKSMHEIMAGLNGKTSMVMGDGRMKSSAIDTYVGGAATVLTQAIFGKKSEYTVINCFVSQFDIKDGIATTKALLFDTEYARITGQGTINLGTERIDLTVDPKPKSVTINTAVPVEIGGTLADPTYRLDPLAAAAKLGGLIGTVVFPPAAVIGLGELGVSDDNPCMKQG
ncbi:MAG: AsmA family protein, partial [Geminicoccales bacterium]